MRQLFILKDGTPLLVREAVYKDAKELSALIRSIVDDVENGFFYLEHFEKTNLVEAQLQRIKDYAALPGKCIFVAETNQKLLGIIDFWSECDNNTKSGELELGVLPQYRDKGVGACLLQVLLNWATENPLIQEVKLSVLATNKRALNLYQKMGFVEKSRRLVEMKTADDNSFEVLQLSKKLLS